MPDCWPTVTVGTISTLTGYMASMSTSYWNSLQVKGTLTSARVTAIVNATRLENFTADASQLKGTLTQPTLPSNAIYTGLPYCTATSRLPPVPHHVRIKMMSS